VKKTKAAKNKSAEKRVGIKAYSYTLSWSVRWTWHMQTLADRQLKFIIVYHKHLTKFVLLSALTIKHADKVAYYW